MYYYLINQDLEVVDGIEMFESMIWTEKYSDIGDFELYLPADEKSMKLYQEAAKKHYYIVKADDENGLSNLSAMEVETVKTDTNVSTANKLIVTGKQLKNILYRRIITGSGAVSGPIQNEFRRIVNENAIICPDQDRVIPRLVLGDLVDGMDNILINSNYKGSNLARAFKEMSAYKKVGWDIRIDIINQQLKFIMLNGTDRTSEVIFSNSFNNLIKTSYSIDVENYRNVAYVYSSYEKLDELTGLVEKVDNTQVTQLYDKSSRPAGLNRYELYIDGSSTTSSIEGTTQGFQGSILQAKGRAELENYKSVIKVDGEVVPDISFVFRRDYFLGDLVRIENEYGITYDARVTSITTSVSAKKNSVVPSFTIENYTGKEEDDDDKYTDENARITQDGQYRACESGEGRKISEGLEYRERVAIDENGVWQTRVTQDGEEREVTKNEYFDDEKYNI